MGSGLLTAPLRRENLMQATERLKRSTVPSAVLAACAVLFTATAGTAGTVHDDFPDRYDIDQSYIIYLHGAIVEREGVNATSAQFGSYDFTEIVSALAAGDADVIAPVRSGDVDAHRYATEIGREIIRMIASDVRPQQITVAGFSKGGYMTLMAARRLGEQSLRYVVMAGCTENIADGSDMRADGLYGNILSMVDASDDLAFSCMPLFARNRQLNDPQEIIFTNGTGHGFFYEADPAWTDMVLQWSAAGLDD